MPVDAPLRRKPRRRPTTRHTATVRGPQGLPTQANSPSRTQRPRYTAPARPVNRPATVPVAHRGPQGLPGGPRPKITKQIHYDRKRAVALRARDQRNTIKRAQRTKLFGPPKVPTFGMSQQSFQHAKAQGNKAYAREQAKKPSFKKDLANIGKALSNTSDFLQHQAEKAHLAPHPGAELKEIGQARHKAISMIGEAPLKAAEHVNATIPIRKPNSYEKAMGIEPGKLGRETIDVVSSLPSSTYLTGAALKEGVVDHDWRRGNKLVKDWNKTSAVAAATKGHWREALERANERPVSTALEASGAKALVGRTAGAVGRTGVLGHGVKKATGTKRANLRLYPEAKPGEGPEIARDYSRDVINKGLQKLGERHAKRQGRDPNVDYGSHLAPRLPKGGKHANNDLRRPLRSRLTRQVDTDVAGFERARRRRIEKTREAVSRIVPSGRGSRYPGGRRKGMVKADEGAGVQLAAEGTTRIGKVRADLRKRRLVLVKEAPRLRREDPARYELNRQEREEIAHLESLSDERLNERIPEAAEALHEQQKVVQARGRKVGAWDELGQSKRFYPVLQSHIKTPARTEGAVLDLSTRKPLHVAPGKGATRAQQAAAKAARRMPAAERAAQDAVARIERQAEIRARATKASNHSPEQQRIAAKKVVQRVYQGKPVGPKAQAAAEAAIRARQEVSPHKVGASGVNEASLQALADIMGVKQPVALRPLTKTMEANGTRSGYGGIVRDAHDNVERHVVYYNPKHGVGAKNAALIHELQHAADREAALRGGPEANTAGTVGLPDKQYQALRSEQRANAAMERHADHDLFDEPEVQAILRAAGRPKVGQKHALTRGDLRRYVQRLQTKQHVPARSLHPDQLEEMARILQRRDRRGQDTLPSLQGRQPTLITQRPVKLKPGGEDVGMYKPNFPAPNMPGQARSGQAFAEGSREVGADAIMRQAMAAETTVTAAEGFQLLARKYGMKSGVKGREFAASYNEALQQAQRYQTPMVPVNIAEFTRFGARLRRAQEESVPGSRQHVAAEQDILREAWDSALNNESGRGKWVLFPEDVVARFREHAGVGTNGLMNQWTNLFKDVVLTTSSPSHWIGGNVGDLGTRSLFEGLTPLDVVRGNRIANRTEKLGLQGEMATAATTGGGLYHVGENVGRMFRAERVNEPLARTVLFAPYRAWKGGIYALEHAIEVLPQYGAVGKQFRRDTDLGRMDGLMKRDLKKLAGLHDELVDQYAYHMANDHALEAKVQARVENVIGRWGKVSPAMRKSLVFAPFAQWLGAATRYVYLTLPVHHPIKTAILLGISEMTLKERQRLGLSYLLPRDQQAQDYQMGTLPMKVGQNKYGPTVEGIRTSRMTSFGTAAFAPNELQNFVLPQFSGALDALVGQSYTGEKLVYPDWWPDKDLIGLEIPPSDRYKIGLGALMESTMPFASMFRRTVLENGRPSDPTSTLLTPRTRKKYNKDTGKYDDYPAAKREGLIKWLMPYSPPSRVMTYGAVRSIKEQGITGRTLDLWREAAKKAKAERGRVGVPLRDPSAVTPARQQDGGVVPLRGAPPKKNRQPGQAKSTPGVIDLR